MKKLSSIALMFVLFSCCATADEPRKSSPTKKAPQAADHQLEEEVPLKDFTLVFDRNAPMGSSMSKAALGLYLERGSYGVSIDDTWLLHNPSVMTFSWHRDSGGDLSIRCDGGDPILCSRVRFECHRGFGFVLPTIGILRSCYGDAVQIRSYHLEDDPERIRILRAAYRYPFDFPAQARELGLTERQLADERRKLFRGD